MAKLAHYEDTVLNSSGNPVVSVSVELRKQGATVNADQSGTSALTVTVNDPGMIAAADTVQIWRTETTAVSSGGGESTFTVDSKTATTVVLSGFTGTLTLLDEDRLSPTTNLVSLFNDVKGDESLTNPLTTSAVGFASGWSSRQLFDVHLSGGSPTAVTTRLKNDRVAMRQEFPFISVKDFGATGDNSTDDLAAIQAAIDSVSSSGGTIFFPVGSYKISAGLSTTQQAIRFLGAAGTTHNDGGTPFFGSTIVSSVNSITLLNVGDATLRHQGPVFEHLGFVDGGSTGKTCTLLKITEYNNWTVRNCSFRDGSVGLHVNGNDSDASWGYVSQCQFRDNTTGILSDSSNQGGSFMVSGGNIIMKTNNQTGIKVSVHQVRIVGIKIDGVSGGSGNSIGIDFQNETIASMIIGCTLENCADSIKLNGSHATVRTENQVVGCNITGDGTGTGITIGSSEKAAKVIGCRISNHTTRISDSGADSFVLGEGDGSVVAQSPIRFNTSGLGFLMQVSRDGVEAFHINTAGSGFALDMTNAAAGSDMIFVLAGDTSGEKFEIRNETGTAIFQVFGDGSMALGSLSAPLNFGAATELTISSGAITATKSNHKLQPESGTTDNLDTINGGTEGDILMLYTTDSGDIITLTESGNIILGDQGAGGQIQLLRTVTAGPTTDAIAIANLYFNGTNWLFQHQTKD